MDFSVYDRVANFARSDRNDLVNPADLNLYAKNAPSSTSVPPHLVLPGTAVIKTTRIQEHGLVFGSLV